MINKYLILSLFLPMFLLAPESEKMFASSDIWSSVATKGVRSPHSINVSQYFFEDSERGGLGIDLFFQTSWGLSDNPKFFKDIIDIEVIKNRLKTFLETKSLQLPNLNFSVDKFSDFLKKITVEEALIGIIIKLSQKWIGFDFGIDIPIIYKAKHPWVSQKERDLIIGNELQNMIEENPEAKELSKIITENDKTQLSDLFNNAKQNIEFGLGDIRLYCEKCFFKKKRHKSSTTCLIGGEFLLPIKKHDSSIHSPLRADRPKFSEQYLADFTNQLTNNINIMATGISNTDLFIEAKKRVIGLIENIFLTAQESAMKPLLDEQRPGVGIYFRPLMRTTSKKVSLFGKIKANYFFEVIHPKVFTTSGDGQYETSKLMANMAPLKHFQGVVGLLFKPNALFYGIGYEFFVRSEENIINVLNAKDDKYVDFSKNINKKNSQNIKSQQHKIFSSIGINTRLCFNSLHFMLTGNYCFSSTGTFRNNWGISLSSGISF